MKKVVLLIAVGLCSGAAMAQRANVENAYFSLNNLELEDAKKYIDLAANHEDTKNDPKMWFYRTAIYDTILHSKNYTNLIDPNSVENFVLAAKGCVTSDVKKKYDYCHDIAIIQSSFDAYNKAYDMLQAKRYEDAIKFFEYVLDNVKFDKEGVLKKNNLTEGNIYNAIYRSAFFDKRLDITRNYSQKLIDAGYNDPLVYYFNAETYLNDGDTTRALEVVSKGRERFQTDKDLLNYELNIYIRQNKTDVLLTKLNDVLTNDPENAMLMYIRGNIYDRMASDRSKRAKDARVESDVLKNKAAREKVPATKAKLEAQAKKQRALSDSLYKELKSLVALAEKDYKKSIEINPDNMDGHYAMGALINNYENTEVADKINNIQASTQADYDKKLAPLKKQQDEILGRALKHFNDALAAVETMSESDDDKKREKRNNKILVLESIKSVYGNMNDEKKFMEIKKQIEELEQE